MQNKPLNHQANQEESSRQDFRMEEVERQDDVPYILIQTRQPQNSVSWSQVWKMQTKYYSILICL